MPQFGVCTSLDNSALLKSQGWDFIEEGVQGLLQGLLPDDQWQGQERARSSALPLRSANVLVPGSLKITGPDADLSKLREYMAVVLRRAQTVGMTRLVFGSGGARNVPDGFDRERAKRQITDFCKASAEIAAKHDVVIVAEPLNKKECNIINTVAEGMEYVRAVAHPNFECLVDSYHFWLEDEPLENLRAAMPSIKHVHVADREGRVAPGESGTSDYKPFFRVLKEGKYDGMISVEGKWPQDFQTIGQRVLNYLKREWEAA